MNFSKWQIDNVEPEPPRNNWWWYRPQSANTEATVYAFLTTPNMVNIDVGLTITRPLSTQRNPWGGFGSTQVCTYKAISRLTRWLSDAAAG